MSPEEPQVVPDDGVSRRRMLKRIGAGAAVAWTAPILTSIRTPAFAVTPSCGKQCDPGQNCAACPFLAACGGDSNCQCWQKSTDQGPGCICSDFVAFCGDTPLCPGGQADCNAAPGGPWCCVETCCGRICTHPTCAAGQARSPNAVGERTTR
jgi:hypothetical protein